MDAHQTCSWPLLPQHPCNEKLLAMQLEMDSDRLTSLETTFGCSHKISPSTPHRRAAAGDECLQLFGPRPMKRRPVCALVFFLLTQRCFLARPLTPLARGCSCFWREPRGEGTRRSSSSSYVLKCRPAIVSLFCILTCVLRCPGAQVPGYSDLVPFCPP